MIHVEVSSPEVCRCAHVPSSTPMSNAGAVTSAMSKSMMHKAGFCGWRCLKSMQTDAMLPPVMAACETLVDALRPGEEAVRPTA